MNPLGCVVPVNSIRFLGHDVHEHDVPHLVHVVTGEVVFSADGSDRLLRRRETVWLRPHVPHAVRVREGAMVLGPVLEPDVVPAGRVRFLGDLPALVDVLTAVLVAAPATDEEIRPFRRALGAVLSEVAHQRFSAPPPVHPVARRLAARALAGDAPLAELAAAHRLSVRQVQRIFLAETGFPFARWRTRARLDLAAGHLAGGGSLSSAARRAGFATRAGLLRALSRETGRSTREIASDPPGALAGQNPWTAR